MISGNVELKEHCNSIDEEHVTTFTTQRFDLIDGDHPEACSSAQRLLHASSFGSTIFPPLRRSFTPQPYTGPPSTRIRRFIPLGANDPVTPIHHQEPDMFQQNTDNQQQSQSVPSLDEEIIKHRVTGEFTCDKSPPSFRGENPNDIKFELRVNLDGSSIPADLKGNIRLEKVSTETEKTLSPSTTDTPDSNNFGQCPRTRADEVSTPPQQPSKTPIREIDNRPPWTHSSWAMNSAEMTMLDTKASTPQTISDFPPSAIHRTITMPPNSSISHSTVTIPSVPFRSPLEESRYPMFVQPFDMRSRDVNSSTWIDQQPPPSSLIHIPSTTTTFNHPTTTISPTPSTTVHSTYYPMTSTDARVSSPPRTTSRVISSTVTSPTTRYSSPTTTVIRRVPYTPTPPQRTVISPNVSPIRHTTFSPTFQPSSSLPSGSVSVVRTGTPPSYQPGRNIVERSVSPIRTIISPSNQPSDSMPERSISPIRASFHPLHEPSPRLPEIVHPSPFLGMCPWKCTASHHDPRCVNTKGSESIDESKGPIEARTHLFPPKTQTADVPIYEIGTPFITSQAGPPVHFTNLEESPVLQTHSVNCDTASESATPRKSKRSKHRKQDKTTSRIPRVERRNRGGGLTSSDESDDEADRRNWETERRAANERNELEKQLEQLRAETAKVQMELENRRKEALVQMEKEETSRRKELAQEVEVCKLRDEQRLKEFQSQMESLYMKMAEKQLDLQKQLEMQRELQEARSVDQQARDKQGGCEAAHDRVEGLLKQLKCWEGQKEAEFESRTDALKRQQADIEGTLERERRRAEAFEKERAALYEERNTKEREAVERECERIWSSLEREKEKLEANDQERIKLFEQQCAFERDILRQQQLEMQKVLEREKERIEVAEKSREERFAQERGLDRERIELHAQIERERLEALEKRILHEKEMQQEKQVMLEERLRDELERLRSKKCLGGSKMQSMKRSGSSSGSSMSSSKSSSHRQPRPNGLMASAEKAEVTIHNSKRFSSASRSMDVQLTTVGIAADCLTLASEQSVISHRHDSFAGSIIRVPARKEKSKAVVMEDKAISAHITCSHIVCKEPLMMKLVADGRRKLRKNQNRKQGGVKTK